MNFTNMTLIDEALRIVFQMSIIVSGSLVFCEIVLRKFSRQIEKVGQILQIDKYSVMGIILSFGTSIAMLPLFSRMNQKGKGYISKMVNSRNRINEKIIFLHVSNTEEICDLMHSFLD